MKKRETPKTQQKPTRRACVCEVAGSEIIDYSEKSFRIEIVRNGRSLNDFVPKSQVSNLVEIKDKVSFELPLWAAAKLYCFEHIVTKLL